jgi:preprotein translocase subunit SecA
MALKNKLINHIDKIKEIVLENELLKYAIKSLKKKLEEKNHNIQQMKVNYNTQNIKKQKQNIFQYNNPAPPQSYQRRNIRNFIKNVQTSLESQRQPPKQSHPKIFIILKRKKFI